MSLENQSNKVSHRSAAVVNENTMISHLLDSLQDGILQDFNIYIAHLHIFFIPILYILRLQRKIKCLR